MSSRDNRAAEDVSSQEPQDPGASSETTSGNEPLELSPEQLTDLKSKAAQASEHWERLVRLTADFDNYKKRAARERQEAVKFANESLLEKLLPVLDTFDMALSAASGGNTENIQSLMTGINMIKHQLRQVLTESGLEEIDASSGPFDPNLHEAVSQQESGEVPEGHIVQQIRRGYKLRERLVRPASVVVAKKPASA